MCTPASFVVTRHAALYDESSDKHEVIIKNNKLDDNQPVPDFVRCEVVPPDGNYSLPFDKWVYRVDQDVLPSWYNAKWAEAECRKALPAWAATRFVSTGKHTCTDGQTLIVVEGKPVITQSGGEVWTFGTSAPVITKAGHA